MTSYEKIWDSVLEIIKENTTPISFETWIKPLKIRKIDNSLNIVYIELTSQKGKDLIEKLEYGRLISPTKESEYSSSRDIFSELPVIFEETKSKCKTFINLQSVKLYWGINSAPICSNSDWI